jgi:hypothetical protein
MVAPIGNTNLVTLESKRRFSSKHLKVTGNVAELSKEQKIKSYLKNYYFSKVFSRNLEEVPNPVITAFVIKMV